MPDDIKSPSSPPPEGEPKPAADQPASPGGVKATPSGSSEAVPVSSETKPAPATPAKPAAAAPAAPATKPAAAPPKPAAPVPTVWDSPMIAKLKQKYGSGVEALTHLGQNYMVVDRSTIPEILQILRNEEEFDYCVDLTAVHYPTREKQFEVVWVLYSFPRNERIRVKTQIADGESLPSSVPIWATANWLEREVFDMFGIKFDGHPDMKRILLPDGWKGHPLRKDYGILQQDNEWVQINLGIESGQ
ncbi:MAG: NADH-quinone oxidoreductase subunit C [Candidatus Sulfotelmatobacter sp.]|jgi:NADH-quinone oxidoreductase subunit C